MAEDFIEEIYSYADIVYRLECIAQDAYMYMDENTVEKLNQIFPQLSRVCEEYIQEDLEAGRVLWNGVKELTNVLGDLLLIGDIIQTKILPPLWIRIAQLAAIDVDLNDKYTIYSTRSGYLTLFSKEENIYLHSMDDPMLAADRFVRTMYDASKKVYYVYGCGLGYEVYQLYLQSDGFTRIILYEPDDNVYMAAMQYGVLGRIPEEFLERRSYKGIDDFLRKVKQEDAGVFVLVSSAHVIPNEEERRKMIILWMQLNSKRQFASDWSSNAIRNDLLQLPTLEQYRYREDLTEAVVVAAGPSLDECVDIIKKWKGKKLLIAVGTVFTKLIREGIVPDCVIMIDPSRVMVEQLRGVEKEQIPLLLDRFAYWKLAYIYEGPKYILPNMPVYGTVSSVAMEVAARLGMRKIYLAGLDLGYPILQSHVSGASGMREINEKDLFEIDSTDGGKVLSDEHLAHYRDGIERQISRHSEIDFYNMSLHGAKIRGCRTYKESMEE